MPKTKNRKNKTPASATASPTRRRARSRVPLAAWYKALVARLDLAAAGCVLQEVGNRTRTNHETVRRYMQNGRVPAQFIVAFCQAYKVEPKWLLTGKGPQKAR